MATFKVFRSTALPGTLEPYALYLIAPSGEADVLEVVATNADGSATRHVINAADVQSMIDASMASAGTNDLVIVADIAARDALSPTSTIYVYVRDATADSTVDSGGARYLYDKTNSAWIKTSEDESMDLVLTWAKITDGPSSTPAQVDDAVSKAHTHANMTQLNKIGENASGLLTYGGAQVKTEYSATEW